MTADSPSEMRSPARGAEWPWWSCAALSSLLQVWALLRFYRRFEYTTATGRIWGLADDVYISACFGRSLVEGHGFVWFPGAPRVEGISNPLWALLIGLLHLLPGFTEDRLGLFVLLLNALLLVLACALFVSAVRRVAGATAFRAALCAVPLIACNVALAYWSAEGFEVALIAVLALAMLRCALWVAPRRRSAAALAAPSAQLDLALGLLFVAGMATRMDFALVAAGPIAVAWCAAGQDAARRLRRVARFAAVVLIGLTGLLIARKLYYGDWLPNTYYLKATRWPIEPRLMRGLRQNAHLVPIALLVWFPVCVARVRAALGSRFVPVAASFAAFSLTVAYSVYVGGDSWGVYGGYDRHTAVGGLFLAFGLCLFATAFGATRVGTVAAIALALGFAGWPVVNGSWERTAPGLFADASPKRALEQTWIRYARNFEQISLPGARLAVCPAGALVYFSHRGGVDLLGKVEPYVAHLPVSFRTPKGSYCWKDMPGHNKEDDVNVFALRKPEFSKYLPPRNVREDYVQVRYKDKEIYVLRDSPLARWDVIPKRAISAVKVGKSP